MTRTRRLAVALVVLLLAPTALAGGHGDRGVMLRLDGDVHIGPNETLDTLVLVGEDSDAHIAGTVGTVVVIGGALELTGTILDQLVLIDAHARLENGSHVQGDITHTDAIIDRDPGAAVDGTTVRGDIGKVAPLLTFLFGTIFLIGLPLALVVTALVAVWLFPRQVHKVGRTLTDDLGPTALTAVLLWLALPLVAFLLLFTLVGIPLAIAILLLLLPLLWLTGYIAAGVRLGGLILTNGGKRPLDKPYLAATIGILLLVLVGLLPVIGALIVLLAGAFGAGALVLAAWRHGKETRGDRGAPPHAVQAAAQDEPWDPSAGGS